MKAAAKSIPELFERGWYAARAWDRHDLRGDDERGDEPWEPLPVPSEFHTCAEFRNGWCAYMDEG